MENLRLYFLIAFGLIFVIEGLLYAIFPSHIQKMMAQASQFNRDQFRSFGLVMMTFGVISTWLILKFTTT